MRKHSNKARSCYWAHKNLIKIRLNLNITPLPSRFSSKKFHSLIQLEKFRKGKSSKSSVFDTEGDGGVDGDGVG